ncbi:MAG: AraC family transcriptional regulator [Phycisphaerales bacterium]
MSNTRQPAPRPHPFVRSLAVRWPAGHRTHPHAHDWGQLVFAATGALAVDAARQRWVLPTHRCLWLPPGTIHDVQAIGETRLRTAYLSPPLAESLHPEVQVLDVSPLFRELLLEIARRNTLYESNELDRCLATLTLAQIEHLPRLALALPLPDDERARRIADRVCRAPGARASLAELARGTGASERTIERIFKAETALSFGRWRQQARLQHAMRILSQGRTVTQTAMDCGYASTSAFIAAFTSTYGITPGRCLRRPTSEDPPPSSASPRSSRATRPT